MMIRVFVLYGQGGFVTSFGMYRLARRIVKEFPRAVVTRHTYDDTAAIAKEIRAHGDAEPIVLIGYSLGANSIPYIASVVPGIRVDLAVCYDPSQYGVGVRVFPVNVKRVLLYHNMGSSGYGHAIFRGPMVEQTDVNTSHFAVCYHEGLHQRTIEAIREIKE